jgi:hypothetical protein
MKKNLFLIFLCTLFTIHASAQESMISKVLGVYQSLEPCMLEMPSFSEKEGPRLMLKIYEESDSFDDVGGDSKVKYYCTFNYCGDYSGQYNYNNRIIGYAEIVKFDFNQSITTLRLRASDCYQSSDNDKESVTSVGEIGVEFTLKLEFLGGEKVRLTTINPPSTCNSCWTLNSAVFQYLVWSK